MTRILIVLAACGLTGLLALAAVASEEPDDPELQPPPAQGLEIPPPPAPGGDADAQGADGDPHELGGGFRDHTRPPVPDQIDRALRLPPLLVLYLRLI